MPKTNKITFNVNDLQREHTGQKRRYDNVGLARLINSPRLQEHHLHSNRAFCHLYV